MATEQRTAKKGGKQHALKGSALLRMSERLGERKAQLSAGMTLSSEMETLTAREKLVVAFAVHEIEKVMRASGSSEAKLR